MRPFTFSMIVALETLFRTCVSTATRTPGISTWVSRSRRGGLGRPWWLCTAWRKTSVKRGVATTGLIKLPCRQVGGVGISRTAMVQARAGFRCRISNADGWLLLKIAL